jgi:tetratricopeptide (TPR) repeat protein
LGTRALIDKNYAESRLAFEKLLTLSEKPEDFRRANEGLMRCATGLKQYATSVQFAEAVLADDKHAPEVRSEAYVIKAHGLLAQGDSAAARAAFDQVVLRTRGGFQAEGFYYQALFLARSKDYSGSNESVFALIDNHPSEVTWRHKGLLLLAENYWGLNDKFQAQYTVDFLLEDSPSGEIKAKAELFKASVSSSPEITRDPQSAK